MDKSSNQETLWYTVIDSWYIRNTHGAVRNRKVYMGGSLAWMENRQFDTAPFSLLSTHSVNEEINQKKLS